MALASEAFDKFMGSFYQVNGRMRFGPYEMLSDGDGAHCEAGRGAGDLVGHCDVTEFLYPVFRKILSKVLGKYRKFDFR